MLHPAMLIYLGRYVGSIPLSQDAIVANEGLGWDFHFPFVVTAPQIKPPWFPTWRWSFRFVGGLRFNRWFENLLKDPIYPPPKLKNHDNPNHPPGGLNIQKGNPTTQVNPTPQLEVRWVFSFQETDLLVVLIMVEPQWLDQKMGCLMSITMGCPAGTE